MRVDARTVPIVVLAVALTAVPASANEIIRASLSGTVLGADVAAIGVMTWQEAGAAQLAVHEVLAGHVGTRVDVTDFLGEGYGITPFAIAAQGRSRLRGVFLLRWQGGVLVPASNAPFAPLSDAPRIRELLAMRRDPGRFVRDPGRRDDVDLVYHVGGAFATPTMRCGDWQAGPAALSWRANAWQDTAALWFDKRSWRVVARITIPNQTQTRLVFEPGATLLPQVEVLEPGPIPEVIDVLRDTARYRRERGERQESVEYVCDVDSRLPARALGLTSDEALRFLRGRLRSRRAAVAVAAFGALTWMQDGHAVDEAIAQLRHRDADVADAAAAFLLASRAPHAIEPLLDAEFHRLARPQAERRPLDARLPLRAGAHVGYQWPWAQVWPVFRRHALAGHPAAIDGVADRATPSQVAELAAALPVNPEAVRRAVMRRVQRDGRMPDHWMLVPASDPLARQAWNDWLRDVAPVRLRAPDPAH